MLWFAGASLLAVIALGFAATAILRRQARGEAIRDAKEITRLAGEGIAEPALNDRLLAGDRAAQARFDHAMRARVLKDPVVRIKLWTLDGRIVYSDKRQLVGRRFALEPEVMSAVRKRLVAAEVSDLDRPENRYERRFGKLLEVYLPIDGPGGRRLLFEDYVRYGAISASEERLFSRFAPARGQRSSCSGWCSCRSRGRSAIAFASASASARPCCNAQSTPRRPNAGASPSTCTTAWCRTWPGSPMRSRRRPAGDRPRSLADVVRDAAASTRRALRELRGLLIGIYPPSLQRSGLEGGGLRPARAARRRAGSRWRRGRRRPRAVPRDRGADLPQRAGGAAQRRQARGSLPGGGEREPLERLGRARRARRRARLRPRRARRRQPSLGLRLLEDLVEERRGRLEVHSGSGHGTRVTVELAAR